MLGSFDFSYYHQLEITFSGVEYLELATMFTPLCFRLGTMEEYRRLQPHVQPSDTCRVYAIETDDQHTFLVMAENVHIHHGRVYYSLRENLQPDEALAPWVQRPSVKGAEEGQDSWPL